MKILSVEQIREADKFTIDHEPVSSIDLMERAAGKCTEWILQHYGNSHWYLIVCGTGNNGGDGLAIARQLFENNCDVAVYHLKPTENTSKDFSENLKRLSKTTVPIYEIADADDLSFLPLSNLIIIDAIFGTGLNREPEIVSAEIIDRINSIEVPKISIDIPSGLFCDDNSNNSFKYVVRATHTLTFQQPKLSFLFVENFPFVGNFHVLPIGIHPDYFYSVETKYNFITIDDAKRLVKPRPKFSHKGTFGHALLVCGSEGKMGAAVLSANACLHAGVGLLTLNVPACGNDILQISVPEAMLQISEGEKIISGKIKTLIGKDSEYSAIGMGPGIGTEKETVQSMKSLIGEYAGPFIFDADALNILSVNKTWYSFLPKETILTPHPGEFDRLTEKHQTGFERMKSAREMAMKFGFYIVLKGAYTSIACPDGNVFFNSSGNSGMATGGSGDVLTGIITALRAQGYDAQSACVLSVYAHGLAGDISASVHSQMGMSANDIVENLGGAWRMLEENNY